MREILLIISILCLTTACKKQIDYSNVQEEDVYRDDFDPYEMDISNDEDAQLYYEATGEYPDGTYCAEIEYYNPNTGTRSTYSLDVDVEDGDMVKIHWSNGGWLDDTHFRPQDITDGDCSFTSDRGYRYTVELQEFGGCGYTEEHKIRRDVNNEVEATTCPNCGNEKDEYDELCDDCQDEIDHTCQRCGGYKTASYDEYCNSCQEEMDNNDY